MSKADPEDRVEISEVTKESGGSGTKSHVFAPLGVAIGLAGAVATGFFLSEEGPPPEMAQEKGPVPAVEREAEQLPNARATAFAQPEQVGQVKPRGMPVFDSELIVKFKDSPRAVEICKMFHKDEIAARDAFEEFAKDKPFLEGLMLKRATYSDEMVLVFKSPPASLSPADLRSRYNTLSNTLRDNPLIKYADINSVARPGKEP